ncbi:MAG: hypothetical protein HY717_07880 [Planctomycetes bacterium]|nr:hypothetical protein [Planctomycetota bacterium]
MKRNRTITATLKKAIRKSKLPFLTIEERTGVKRASIMRFMRGDQSLRLDLAERLTDFFNIKIVKE